MNDELKQIITGIIFFGLIIWGVTSLTNNHSNLSPDIDDRATQ